MLLFHINKLNKPICRPQKCRPQNTQNTSTWAHDETGNIRDYRVEHFLFDFICWPPKKCPVSIEERRFWNSLSRSNHGFGRNAYQANSTNKNTTPSQVKHRITSNPCKELCGNERTGDAKRTTEEWGKAHGRPSHCWGKCFRCPSKQLHENIVRPKKKRVRGGGDAPERLLTTALKRNWKKNTMALSPT